MKKNAFCTALICTLTGWTMLSSSYAQLIYDNAGKTLTSGTRMHPSGDLNPGFGTLGIITQPFQMNGSDNIASVVVPMSRWGTPKGPISFSIWDSDDNSHPGTQIAELGTLEATKLTEAGHPANISKLPPLIFEPDLAELDSEATYHLVIDLSQLEGGFPVSQKTIVNGGLFNDSGTNEAGTLLFESNGELITGDQVGFGNRWLQMSVRPRTDPCDFNADGACDIRDLERNALYAIDLTAGSDDPLDIHRYDITGDNLVNVDDLDAWLIDAASRNGHSSPYLAGDTNLDGAVNFDDFLVLANNFDRRRRDWGDGDFNGDQQVKFDDFLVLSTNFGSGENAVAAVPEPRACSIAALGIFALLRLRRKR